MLRPVAAFVTAMLGGVFTNLLTKGERDTGVKVVGEARQLHHEHEHSHEHDHHDGCCECGHCECELSADSVPVKRGFVEKMQAFRDEKESEVSVHA